VAEAVRRGIETALAKREVKLSSEKKKTPVTLNPDSLARVAEDSQERMVCIMSQESGATTPLRTFMSMSSLNDVGDSELMNEMTSAADLQARVFHLNFPSVFNYSSALDQQALNYLPLLS
jgi:hypothetical protein